MKDQRQLQHRIRQDAEERNNALADLSTWMDQLKVSKPDPQRSQTAAVSSEAGDTFEEIRTRGNEYFAKKQYDKALECYHRCLGNAESMNTPVIYSNLALTHLKLKQYAKAESCCTSALQICSTHSKSLHRRSVARLSLGKLRGALLDAYSLEDSCDTDNALDNVENLKSKCKDALVTAVERAPRRNVKITVV